MKTRIKHLLLLASLAIATSACNLYEHSETHTVPLPNTDIPITYEPWEMPDDEEKDVGK